MPHMFVNRQRHYSAFHDADDLKGQFLWEVFNAVAYELGGFIFIAGSVMFLPQFEDYLAVGSWLFVVGSLMYLIVSAHDFCEVYNMAKDVHHQQRLRRQGQGRKSAVPASPATATATAATTTDEQPVDGAAGFEEGQKQTEKPAETDPLPLANDESHGRIAVDCQAAVLYFVGSILFIIGSIFFLPNIGMVRAGAWTFTFGSVLFIIGACVNSVQIFESPTAKLAFYANQTAVSYVIGSTFFLTASIPYLWEFDSKEDAHTLYEYLGWQYIAGSVLFTVGGTLNMIRSKIYLDHAIAKKDEQ